MNVFTVNYKHEDGTTRDITRHAVSPFIFGLLLDERLDEASLTLIEMRRKHFKPNTDISITLNDGTTEKTLDMIVARDQATKNQLTGKWRHSLYLLERTKKLEGLLCPSLTFTNGLPRNYSKIATRARPIGGSSYFVGIESLTAPAAQSMNFTVPNSATMSQNYAAQINAAQTEYTLTPVASRTDDQTGSTVYYTSYSVYVDGQILTTKLWNEEYTITAEDLSGASLITLTYNMEFQRMGGLTTVGTSALIKFEIPVVKTYAGLKKYTITDCVNRVLECAEPLRSGSVNDSPRYTFDAEQAVQYEAELAPDFTMTQNTLREQLKLIGSFIHAEPRLRADNTVYFEPYGVTRKAPLERFKPVGESASAAINDYCTEIRSNVQNLTSSLGFAEGVTVDPGQGWYRSLRTENMYVRVGESNGITETGLRIYSLREDDEAQIECGILSGDGSWWLSPCNITPFMFERTEYNANLSSYSDVYPFSKSFALYYTQGEKNIGGLFFKPENPVNSDVFERYAISNILGAAQQEKSADEIDTYLNTYAPLLAFSVRYKPIYPALVSHGKSLYIKGDEKYGQIYNQSENLIETKYYGENIRGVAARLGNVEREATFILSKLADLPRLGDMYDGYAISAVSVEFQPYALKCTVGLSKDFNRISEYVGVSSVKRMYEISERMVYNRDILIHNTLIIGKRPSGGLGTALFKTAAGIRDIFLPEDQRTVAAPVSAAFAKGVTKSGEDLTAVTLPVMPTALGNAMTFYFSYKDNYSAGTAVERNTAKDGVIGYWQNDVRYTDYYGRLYNLMFCMSNTVGLTPVASAPIDIPETNLFPYASSPIGGQFKVRKDGRERLSITAELEIKTTYPDIIIGSALARFSRDISTAPVNVIMRIFISPDDSINKFASKVNLKGFIFDVPTFPTPTEIDASGGFTIPSFAAPVAGAGWVIMTAPDLYREEVEDEDGNIVIQETQRGVDLLLASNTPFEAGAPIFGYNEDGTVRDLDFYIIPE